MVFKSTQQKLHMLITYEINQIWNAEMKWKWRNDRRSERNLCNCVRKPEKNSGSNPFEVLNFFQASLRNCINCVHCDDHCFIFKSCIIWENEHNFNIIWPKKEQCYRHNILLLLAQSMKGPSVSRRLCTSLLQYATSTWNKQHFSLPQ